MQPLVRTEVITNLANFLLQELVLDEDTSAIGPTEDLLEDHIDSMGVVRLAAHIEDEFGVALQPQDFTADNFRCLTAIANLIESRAC